MKTAGADKLLLIGFLLLPFIAITGGIIHVAQRTTFYLIVFLVSSYLIKNKWLKSLLIYWCVWTFYLMVCYFLKGANNVTVNTSIFFNIYMLFASLIVYFVSVSKTPKEIFYNFICITAIIQSLIAVGQMWNIDLFFDFYSLFIPVGRGIETIEPCGILGNPNFLAGYLAISLPFFFRKKWCYFLPVIPSIILIAVQSTALVAMLAGSFYYFKDRIKKIWLFAGLVPFGVYLCIFKRSMTIGFSFDNPRFIWWSEAIKQTCTNTLGILFGMGPGAPWGGAFPMHNEWVTIFHHFGLVGLLIAFGYVFTVPRNNKILYTSFMIICICAMGYYPFHLPTVGMLCLIVVGLIERDNRERREQRESLIKE